MPGFPKLHAPMHAWVQQHHQQHMHMLLMSPSVTGNDERLDASSGMEHICNCTKNITASSTHVV